MRIWFDMDGTIADLYAVDGWLADLRAERTRPYEEAKVLLNMSLLARLLHKVQEAGHEVGIISWTSKGGSTWYNARVMAAKYKWLAEHLPSVDWDCVRIVAYGTDKREVTGGGILFDDEEPNRTNWGSGAYAPDKIVEILKEIAKGG